MENVITCGLTPESAREWSLTQSRNDFVKTLASLLETIRRRFPETIADRWESEWRDWLLTPRVEVKVAETINKISGPE